MPFDKYLELLIKYKNIVAALLCLIIAVICFCVGRASVHIPPKEIVCKTEFKRIDDLFHQVEKDKLKHIKEIRELTDMSDKICEKRITDAVDEYAVSTQMIDCRICEAFVGQCAQRGEPICD